MASSDFSTEDIVRSHETDMTVPAVADGTNVMGDAVTEPGDLPRDAHLRPPETDSTSRGSLASRGDLSDDLPGDADESASSPNASVMQGTGPQAPKSRKHRFPMLVPSVISCVALAFCVILLQMLQTISFIPGSNGSQTTQQASVTSDVTGKTPRVDIDYAGLSEMFESEEEETGSDAEWEKWADRLIYYQLWNYKNQWPIPYGCTLPAAKCYNCADTCALCMLTGDFTITPDDVMNEAYEYYHRSKSEIIYPWDTQRMWKEKYKLVTIKHKNSDVPKKDMVEVVKEGLKKGHIFSIGPGNWYPFYTHNGNTRIPSDIGGHCVLLYKYEDGVYWIKDSTIGPMVPYPEEGGAIDANEWIMKSGDRLGFVEMFLEGNEEKTVRPKIKKPESYPEVEHPVNVMKEHPLIPESLRRKYANNHLKGSGGSSPSGSSAVATTGASSRPPDTFAEPTSQAETAGDEEEATLSPESVSAPTSAMEPADAAKDDGNEADEIMAAVDKSPPVGEGRSAEWVMSVLERMDPSVSGMASSGRCGYQLYGAFCDHTVRDDPMMSTLRPGMVIGVPITNGGSQEERSDGHFGIYLGDFQVAHDTGKVEVTSLGDFMARYGECCDIGWGQVTADKGDADEGASVASEDGGGTTTLQTASVTIPMPASHGAASVEAIEASVREHLRRACQGRLVSSVDLMRSWDIPSDGEDGRQATGTSYRATLADGTDIGFVVTCDDTPNPVVTECRYLWVSDGSFYDTRGREYLQMGENEWVTTDWDEMKRLMDQVVE